MKKLKQLIIDRKKWGTGSNGGYLRNPHNGMMCCLGFAAKQLCGASSRIITNRGNPSEFAQIRNSKAARKVADRLKSIGLVGPNDNDTGVCVILIETNDSEVMRNPTREKRITKHFRKLGVRVKFIN